MSYAAVVIQGMALDVRVPDVSLDEATAKAAAEAEATKLNAQAQGESEGYTARVVKVGS